MPGASSTTSSKRTRSPIAAEGLRRIGALYAIERDINGLPADAYTSRDLVVSSTARCRRRMPIRVSAAARPDPVPVLPGYSASPDFSEAWMSAILPDVMPAALANSGHLATAARTSSITRLMRLDERPAARPSDSR